MTYDELAQRLRTLASEFPAQAESALDALRAAFEASADVFKRRSAIGAQIGAAEQPEWRDALVRLRDLYEVRTLADMVSEIDKAFARSPDHGWTAWLRSVAEAVLQFRPRYELGLCAPAFPFDAPHQAAVAKIRRAVDCMIQSRWDELGEDVAFLAAQEALSTPARARLVAIQAQIEMWRFSEKKRASVLAEEARQMSPDDGWILATVGDCYLEQGEPEKAVACYERSIAVAPTDANGYTGMGGRHEHARQFDQAEHWYREAMARAGGDPSGYERMIRILARHSDITSSGAQIQELLDRRNAVDPEGEYDIFLTMGSYCKEAGLLDDALCWYEKARAKATNWPRAYAELAELWQQQGDSAQAEVLGRQAVELAPECPTGYVFLGRLYEKQRRWGDAARIYESFPAQPHYWTAYARVALARINAAGGHHDDAQRQLLELLREEVDAGQECLYAEGGLEELAESFYKQRDDPVTAQSLYIHILQAVGERYRVRYHNLVGNMHYYRNNYAEAAQHYRLGSQAEPKSASFHHFLADACRAMGKFDEARREIDIAFELDGDEKYRAEDLATLANTRGNRAYEQSAFRDAIGHYTQAVELVPAKAVYCSNLAQAWELLKEPGRRIENLEEAELWYARTQRVAGDQSQARRIDQLRRRQQVARDYGEQALDWVSLVTPIEVEVAADLLPLIQAPIETKLTDELANAIQVMRKALSDKLGLTVPGIRFRGNEGDLPNGTYIVMINEVALVSGTLAVERRFYSGSVERLAELGIEGEPATDPVSGVPGAWVGKGDWDRFDSSELWTVVQYLVRHVEAVVRRNAAEFVGHQEVVTLLKAGSDALRTQIHPLSDALSTLTNVCKALVAESVPIRPFEELCRAFKTLHDDGAPPRDIVERVRLLPGFREYLPGRNGQRRYLRCSERFEAAIRGSLHRQGDRAVLAMEPSRCQDSLSAVRAEAKEGAAVLVLTDAALRPFVRKLVEFEFPDLPVLSVAETRDGTDYASTHLDLDRTALSEPSMRCGATPTTFGRFDLEPMAGGATGATPAHEINVLVAKGFLARRSPCDAMDLTEILSRMRDSLFSELGILVPRVQVREDDRLSSAEFEVRLGGGEAVSLGGLEPDEFLVNDSPSRLLLLGLQGRDSKNPANGNSCTILDDPAKTLETCRQAGLSVWGPAGYLVLQLSASIRRDAPALLTDETTRFLLESLSAEFPDLVQAAVKRFPVARLAQVLRHLLAEEISIRNLRGILDALLCLDGATDVDLERYIVFPTNAEPLCPDTLRRMPADLPAGLLADYVRTCLKRYISHKYTQGSSTLIVYLLSPAIEQRLREAWVRPLSADETAHLTAAARAGLPDDGNSARAVVLTNFDVRASARRVLSITFPTVPVLCYQELSPELNIQPIARIDWP